jgi:hypothetical protein
MMDDAVAVSLTPPQAKHIAASMRIALAARFEGAWPYPLPERADVEGLRALVNSYADELAMLEWGEPRGDVELLSQRVRLERLARELIEAGAERINDQPIAGREGRDMISAAQAINAVLARDRSPAAGA